MKFTHVGFTGTKKGMTVAQFQLVAQWLLWEDASDRAWYFHDGDCIGADAQIACYANVLPNCRTICHPPIDESKRAFVPHDEYRKPKKYLTRDHDIVDETGILLAAPRELIHDHCRHGTCATARYSLGNMGRVVIFYPDGTWKDSALGEI